jgi:tRNA threonylcarbamoyladenosine biosynthesis protein TsaB
MQGLTHSKTLMPMIDDILKNTDFSLKDMDYLAASTGPGSFTGLRIGLSTLKGLCLGAGKQAFGVSTLLALAQNCRGLHEDAVICAAMDARRNEFYSAFFTLSGDKIERLCEDRAIPCSGASD